MDKKTLFEKLKNATPGVQGDLETFIDADDEMRIIAQYIKKNNLHNENIEPDRIKFLYSPKPKKDGGRFVLTDVFKRSDMEKMVNDEFDFIVTAFYDVWKKLDPEQKLIVLDKALCGVEIVDESKTKKRAPDSKEYLSNMHFYGADNVMKISEIIDMSCASALEQRKENAKNAGGPIDANVLDA